MCTYNGERFLREQLDSILSQTYPLLEVIIQDDHSTDGTMDILNRYAREHEVVKVFTNDGERGVNNNFYSAMSRAKGDLIAISDQDDVWLPKKIETLVAHLGDNLLIGSRNRQFVGEDDKDADVETDTRTPNISLLRMVHATPMAGHTLLFRRELLELIDNDKRQWVMYDALLQVLAATQNKATIVPEVLVMWRRHTDAATYTKPLSRQRSIGNIIDTIRNDIRLYSTTREQRHFQAQRWLWVLDALPYNNSTVDETRRYLKLFGKDGIIAYIRRTLFCLRHHNQLLHAVEKNAAYSMARALFFPISSAVYVRNLKIPKQLQLARQSKSSKHETPSQDRHQCHDVVL